MRSRAIQYRQVYRKVGACTAVDDRRSLTCRRYDAADCCRPTCTWVSPQGVVPYGTARRRCQSANQRCQERNERQKIATKKERTCAILSRAVAAAATSSAPMSSVRDAPEPDTFRGVAAMRREAPSIAASNSSSQSLQMRSSIAAIETPTAWPGADKAAVRK